MNVEAKIRALNAEREKAGLRPLSDGEEIQLYRQEAIFARESRVEGAAPRPTPPAVRSETAGMMSPGMVAYQRDLERRQEKLTDAIGDLQRAREENV